VRSAPANMSSLVCWLPNDWTERPTVNYTSAKAFALMQTTRERAPIVKALCLLCMALVFAMGTVQAVHSHPAKSQTSHHSCSICSAPSIGPAAIAVDLLPMAKPVALAYSAREIFVAFRPVLTNFVRPPPAPAV
jgi:hypothetical protein